MPTKEKVQVEIPYLMKFKLKGTRPFLFQNSPETLDPESRPKVMKKADYEKMVWRTPDGGLAFPGRRMVFRLSTAAEAMNNPKPYGKGSAEKSVKLAISFSDGYDLCPFSKDGEPITEWDTVQTDWVGKWTGGYARRPSLDPGWEIEVEYLCSISSWFPAKTLHQLVSILGSIGIGDGTAIGYGRCVIVNVDGPKNIESWV